MQAWRCGGGGGAHVVRYVSYMRQNMYMAMGMTEMMGPQSCASTHIDQLIINDALHHCVCLPQVGRKALKVSCRL